VSGRAARRRTRSAAVLAGVLGVLGVLGGAACRPDDTAATEQIEPIALPPPPTEERPGEEPGFTAVLTPEHQADVIAPYTSASARLQVKLGDAVEKGQVLARLDDRQLRQELDAAKAQLRTANAAILQAQVDERGAQAVLQRERRAETEGVGSRADLTNATQAVARARATITVAEATAAERATRIKQLEAHLAEMTLVAPIAGRVAVIYPNDGARVEEGQPVIRIISGGVYVKFAIPAEQTGAVKPGDTVDLHLDRRANPLTATVRHVSPELDAVAQMIMADAELPNPPADLQPGTVGRILPRAR
jgi:RND family efflux transporter MFP subunit